MHGKEKPAASGLPGVPVHVADRCRHVHCQGHHRDGDGGGDRPPESRCNERQPDEHPGTGPRESIPRSVRRTNRRVASDGTSFHTSRAMGHPRGSAITAGTRATRVVACAKGNATSRTSTRSRQAIRSSDTRAGTQLRHDLRTVCSRPRRPRTRARESCSATVCAASSASGASAGSRRAPWPPPASQPLARRP